MPPLMPLFFLIAPAQASLPLFRQINAGLVAALFAAMLALTCLPLLARHIRGGANLSSPFPCRGDIAGALLIALVLTGFCCLGELGASDKEEHVHFLSFALSQLFSVCLFLPAIIRTAEHRAVPVFPGNKLAWFVGGLGGAYLLIGFYALSGLPVWIAELTQSPLEQNIITSFSQAAPIDKIAIAAGAVLLAPFLEETFFRGYLYRAVRSSAGVWPAMIVVSLFFGAVHMSLVQFLPLAIFGLILNLVYEKTGRLWLSMAMHATFNAIGVAAVYAQPYLQQYLENQA